MRPGLVLQAWLHCVSLRCDEGKKLWEGMHAESLLMTSGDIWTSGSAKHWSANTPCHACSCLVAKFSEKQKLDKADGSGRQQLAQKQAVWSNLR